MGETEPQLAVFCCQVKLPVLRLGYIQLSYWTKEFPGSSQTAQAVAVAEPQQWFRGESWTAEVCNLTKLSKEGRTKVRGVVSEVLGVRQKVR